MGIAVYMGVNMKDMARLKGTKGKQGRLVSIDAPAVHRRALLSCT